jgi:hypothetical protein
MGADEWLRRRMACRRDSRRGIRIQTKGDCTTRPDPELLEVSDEVYQPSTSCLTVSGNPAKLTGKSIQRDLIPLDTMDPAG